MIDYNIPYSSTAELLLVECSASSVEQDLLVEVHLTHQTPRYPWLLPEIQLISNENTQIMKKQRIKKKQHYLL